MSTNKKILVIEDEKPLCEAIKFKLERAGIEVAAANSAEEAINFLEKNGFDLIWLDLKLPKMSGIDFLKFLRNNPEWKNKKVFIVSASGSDEIKEKTRQFEIVDYLVKNDYSLDGIVKRAALV